MKRRAGMRVLRENWRDNPVIAWTQIVIYYGGAFVLIAVFLY